MSPQMAAPARPDAVPAARNALYRAVWRWHFYAGLIVLPVLVWMALTGALYLYKLEIERLVYRDWLYAQAHGAPQPLARLIPAVEQQTGGRVTQIMQPADPAESWRMTVERGEQSITAFLRPDTGRVLGTSAEGGVMETVRELHSLAITGPVGNALVEIVAGWTALLVLTGFYLWWPRRGQKAVALRGRPRERRFWRDFHASLGAIAGLVILFLAVTGLPWSVMWGDALQRQVTARGLGRPDAPGATPAEADARHGHGPASSALPWSLQAAAPPAASGLGDIGADRALVVASAESFAAPLTLSLPAAPGKAYVVSSIPNRAQEARVLYLNPSDGAVLQDARYRDFGAGAQAIEWGIYTHQGQQYGEINRLLMLLGCISVLLLAVSAPILWSKRRVKGRLREPPRPADPRKVRGIAAIMLAIGALFPLTGLTMIAALAGEWIVRSLRRKDANAG